MTCLGACGVVVEDDEEGDLGVWGGEAVFDLGAESAGVGVGRREGGEEGVAGLAGGFLGHGGLDEVRRV